MEGTVGSGLVEGPLPPAVLMVAVGCLGVGVLPSLTVCRRRLGSHGNCCITAALDLDPSEKLSVEKARMGIITPGYSQGT